MRISIVLTALALGAPLPAAADPIFTYFDVPGAKFTYVGAVNSSGEIAGDFRSRHGACGQACGFLRAPDGTFTTFSVFRAEGLSIYGLNSSGTVVGQFTGRRRGHGFLRTSAGIVTAVDFPHSNTIVSAINDAGFTTGEAYHSDGSRGFVRAPDGTATLFKAGHFRYTWPSGINTSGTVVGTGGPPAEPSLAFLRSVDGTITTFEAPGAARGTVAGPIDDAGEVAGYFLDTAFAFHGFIRDADGTFHVFDIAGAFGITIAAIVQVGGDRQVIGSVLEPDFHWHGFVRHDDGAVETFDVSQASERYAGSHTAGATPSGVVAGTYTDDLKAWHGYLRTP